MNAFFVFLLGQSRALDPRWHLLVLKADMHPTLTNRSLQSHHFLHALMFFACTANRHYSLFAVDLALQHFTNMFNSIPQLETK